MGFLTKAKRQCFKAGSTLAKVDAVLHPQKAIRYVVFRTATKHNWSKLIFGKSRSRTRII